MTFSSQIEKLLANVTSVKAEMISDGVLDQALPESLRLVFAELGQHRLVKKYNKLSPALVCETDGLTRFALGHQNAIIWAFDAKTGNNPKVFQGQVSDQKIEWYEEPERMQSFLITFLYWNAANGGADYTLVGDVSKARKRELSKSVEVWCCPDFSVQQGTDCLFVITAQTIYVFGANGQAVQDFAKKFDVTINFFGDRFSDE